MRNTYFFTLNIYLGGYVGLLIGASAIKLADFNGYLLDLCFGKCKKSEVLNEYPTKSSTTITVQTQDPKNGWIVCMYLWNRLIKPFFRINCSQNQLKSWYR